MQGQFDIIVIGSGLGGLECGAMLAREGMGVCVAEQAALPGGCLQSFSRRGHAIDTGMHYIGSMQAGGIMRRYFEYFGILGSLRLRPLDEAFDVVSLPGAGDYAYMHGYEAFEKHLGEWFPHEKAGLGRYCAKLREIGGSIGIGVHRTGHWYNIAVLPHRLENSRENCMFAPVLVRSNLSREIRRLLHRGIAL